LGTKKGTANARATGRFVSIVAFAVLLAHGAAAQPPERFAPPLARPSELRPRPPLKDALPLDPPTTWTCQQWRFLDSKTFGGWRGWFLVGSPQLVEYGYQLTELMRIGGRFINRSIAPDVQSGLQLLVDGTLSHDVDMWTTGNRRMWRACYEYERDAVRRDEIDRIMRRGNYACVGCSYGGAR
jgi:hypothetical protein